MNKIDVYKQILGDVISMQMSNEEVLLHMVVLHTHSIVVNSDVSIEDVNLNHEGQGIVLAPLTRRHLAELVSSLWESHEQRGDAAFWYSSYDRLTPYELFDDIKDELRKKALTAKMNIANNDLVDELIEE